MNNVEELIEAFKDENADVCEAAAYALGEILNANAILVDDTTYSETQ